MKKTYLIKYVFLLFFVLSAAAAFAQSNVVSGKVVDETNQPLPGATVTVKGTQKSTGTDANGNFRLTGVPNGTVTLQISFVGYLAMEKVLNVTGNVTVNAVQLTPSAKGLNEVVVIGYGTARKKDLTGSITNITSKDFNTGAVTSPEQLIQGKVAGVSIISNSGAPGAGSTIRIRGTNSLNGNQDPLIVLDGVPLSNTTIAGAANALDLINPNDIESFSVLKDASAAAIYGNRASSGVILITTKKGKSGKPVINFSTQLSAAKIVKEVGVLSPSQFRQFITANDTGPQAGQYTKYLGNANTDWQKEIYQTGITSNSNISISGTTAKIPYRISAGYFDQKGVLKTSSLKRYTGSINLSPSLFTDHLKINFNATGSQVNQRFADEGAIGNAFAFNPTVPVYSGNDNYGGFTQYVLGGQLQKNTPVNPVGVLDQKRDLSTVYRAIVSLALDYKFHFLPDLHANINLGYDGARGRGTTTVSDSSATAYKTTNINGTFEGGSSTRYFHTYDNKLFEGFLSYGKDIKSIHSRIDAVAGYSYQDYADDQHNYEGNFYDGTPNVLTIPTYALTTNENRLLSYYARLNYAFMDKYILTGTIRDDLSSKFAPGLQSGIFPSAAFAWRIKQEDFLKDDPTLSDLKLRIGYGVTGNQDGIGDYDYLADYAVSNQTAEYQVGNNYYQLYRPGAYYFNRTWEQTATSNIGLDYGFLNNRITGTIDYYYKKTSKLLATIGQAALANFSNQIVGNVGSMENNGIEFNINADLIQSKDLKWDVGFNASYNHNKVLALPGATAAGLQGGAISGGTGSKILDAKVGEPANSFYVLQQVYGSNGLPLENVFVDRNGDGTISDKDLYYYQTIAPKAFFGLNSNITYKRWNAGFVARASIGNYVYNNIASNRGIVSNFLQSVSGGYIINGSNQVLDSHLIGGTANDRLSDYYVQNASFFKMDDMHIGYNFGSLFKNTATLGITADVQNVFTITKYKGVDPELSSGIDNQIYPRPRTYTLGLNLNVK